MATYVGVHDELRRAYARTPEAKAAGYKAGDFSYNTGRLRCPTCDGIGSISLDVQFLPDVDITCPECRGSRYAAAASRIHRAPKGAAGDAAGPAAGLTLPQLMAMSVEEALDACRDIRRVASRLQTLCDLGLGYLTLGEATLLGVFDRLVLAGATVVVIEHDLDLIANADYVVDMGPGGGSEGGRVVACGTPEQVAANPDSVTGRYL